MPSTLDATVRSRADAHAAHTLDGFERRPFVWDGGAMKVGKSDAVEVWDAGTNYRKKRSLKSKIVFFCFFDSHQPL
jgi:hypothetical protein